MTLISKKQKKVHRKKANQDEQDHIKKIGEIDNPIMGNSFHQ
jgi:hypothetical protein